MIKEIRIPKPFSIKNLRPIADNEKLQPASQLDYETYFIFEEEKSKALSPKNVKLEGIPFINSPRKIRFNCPECGKTIITTAQLNRENTRIDCEIQYCFNCGQELDWRL